MNKVPAHIKIAIQKSAKHYQVAVEQSNIVRNWIDEIMGSEYTGELHHDMFLDQLIDGAESGLNKPDVIIKTYEEFLKEEWHK